MRIYDRPHSLSDDGSVEGAATTATSDAGQRKMNALRSFSDSSVEGDPTPHTIEAERDSAGAEATVVMPKPSSIRRARHAEILLADRAITSHGRTWVRLRWPGELGGFGGFVAMDSSFKDEGESQTALICRETSVEYPSSKGMKLLEGYDDGIGERMEGDEMEGEVSFHFVLN
jgi:hypothetical protein